MTTPTAPPGRPRAGAGGVREWARRRRTTHLALRVVVLALGSVLVAVGAVLLVLPGPGWALIVLGLVVLASEFAWAQRRLEPVRRLAERGVDALRERPGGPAILRGLVVAGCLSLVGAAAFAVTALT